MKKLKIFVIAFLGLMLFAQCESFDDINNDSTRMSTATAGSFLNPTLYGMGCFNWNRFDDYTFQVMQGIVSTSSTAGRGWYHFSDNEGSSTWTTYYKWLNNAKAIYNYGVQSGMRNYQAIGLTLEAWMFETLTETFGNVPVDEACKGDNGVYYPKFDTQQHAFQVVLSDLAMADTLFTPSQGLKYNKNGDMLYCTSATDKDGIAKWRKLANSLRLRCLLRLLNVSGFDAASQLKQICENPDKYPVMTSNDDGAGVSISGVAPEEQPMPRVSDIDCYLVLSKFFVDQLNEWNDPRRQVWASQVTNDGVKGYYGMPSGYDVMPSMEASTPLRSLATAPMKLMIMPYAEVEFIKAELAQRGIISGSAADYYKKAVTASMEQWGVTAPDGYFDQPSVKYDGTLKRIMQQKYYALFFVDYQQWFEYLRTGYPDVPRGEGVAATESMPSRLKYPIILQRTNAANYEEAVKAMGGDTFHNKLIWQK